MAQLHRRRGCIPAGANHKHKTKRMNIENVIGLLSPADRAKVAAALVPFKKQRADKLHERDFTGYLLTFESHERLDPFIQIVSLLTDAEYWKQVREVWMMAEVVEPYKKIWLHLFQSKRPGRELLMTDADRRAFAAMPDEIKIWRGCGDKAGVRGLSWTTDKSRAAFFSNYAGGVRRGALTGRCGRSQIVASAVCRKADVLALFTERGESEIVLNPAHLHALEISPICPGNGQVGANRNHKKKVLT